MVMHAPSTDSVASRRMRRWIVSLLGALAFSAASVLAGTVPAAGQQPRPNAPTQPAAAGDAANSRAAQIASLKLQISKLNDQIKELETQLKNLMAQEPRDPGPNATDEERKKFSKAHAQWQQSVDKVKGSIANVTAQRDAAKKKLAVLQAGG